MCAGVEAGTSTQKKHSRDENDESSDDDNKILESTDNLQKMLLIKQIRVAEAQEKAAKAVEKTAKLLEQLVEKYLSKE